MSNDVYDRLADALDKLPNGFPRTSSNVEIRILKKIFTPDEASLAYQLSAEMESLEAIAHRLKLDVKEARTRFMDLAKRGLIWFDKQGKKPRFRLAPFIVGIYEAQLENMDHEFAHLLEQYMSEGGAVGIMSPHPALHRVIPAQSTLKSEWILPYDDVRTVLLASKAFSVRDCICRVQQNHVGRRCNFPLRNCLSFTSVERPPNPDDIPQEEALAILTQAEEVGLVHTVSNVAKDFGYVCNCCGCCCGILRGITDWGIENSVAHANYYVTINPKTCTGCGTCRKRCQVGAISEKDGVSIVNLKRCIGCGLCVSGCPDDVAKLYPKPEDQIVPPPADYASWERERLLNRGLI